LTLKNREFRTIPLNRELREVLLPLRKESGRCFTDPEGRQLGSASNLHHEFGRLIVRRSGLPHFSLHALRQTLTSHLVMRRVSINEVSQWLGIGRSKCYQWRRRCGMVNEHGPWIPRDFWLEG